MTTLVDVRDLNVRFSGERTVHAVNNLSFSVGEGEVLGWSWLFPPYRWKFAARTVETTRAIAIEGQ